MATEAPISGGVTTLLGVYAQQLSSLTTPCRQISIRSHLDNDEISVGNAGVTVGDRYAFLLELENYTIGPFDAGQGIRPCDVYVVGTMGNAVTWSGVYA